MVNKHRGLGNTLLTGLQMSLRCHQSSDGPSDEFRWESASGCCLFVCFYHEKTKSSFLSVHQGLGSSTPNLSVLVLKVRV